MKLRLLFFGRLREELKTAEETIELPATSATLADVAAVLRTRGGAWAVELAEGRALAFAVQQEFAPLSAPVRDGDEVAIFPPVTGG